ncbi:hypothetical protein CEXT_660441 [Caerostris extrusa]|uniref:Uncharacterized protein n=1 Tax=Caerostris extrusa TaxID=172846 RepID=A0AAV4X2F5_CAEEX|nr:hypothetical protein CEXT_660441 [Caerostris extrusa]
MTTFPASSSSSWLTCPRTMSCPRRSSSISTAPPTSLGARSTSGTSCSTQSQSVQKHKSRDEARLQIPMENPSV